MGAGNCAQDAEEVRRITLSLNMIRKLHQRLRIPAEVLMQPARHSGAPQTLSYIR